MEVRSGGGGEREEGREEELWLLHLKKKKKPWLDGQEVYLSVACEALNWMGSFLTNF